MCGNWCRRLVSARTWTRLRTLVVRHLHRRRQDFPRLISRSRSKSLPMLLSNNACTHALFRTAAVIASTAGGGGEDTAFQFQFYHHCSFFFSPITIHYILIIILIFRTIIIIFDVRFCTHTKRRENHASCSEVSNCIRLHTRENKKNWTSRVYREIFYRSRYLTQIMKFADIFFIFARSSLYLTGFAKRALCHLS